MNIRETNSDPLESTDHNKSGGQVYYGVHARAIIIGTLLVIAMGCIAPYSDLVVGQIELGSLQFAPGAVGAFLVFYLAIKALRKMGYVKWMNAADMLTIYVMLFVGVFVVCRGLLERLIPTLTYVNYYATPENGYTSLFSGHLKHALVAFNPADPGHQSVATLFYVGGRNVAIPWSEWIVPLLSWFTLFSLIIWTFLCLSTILRRQWADSERLSFPLTILPIQLIDENDAAALFRNPLTWIGIGIPFCIYLLNGFHETFPIIPQIPLLFLNLQQTWTIPPFNNIESISIYVSFAAIGFAYLLPSDLLFSLWFFFALTRIGDIISASIGIVPVGMPTFPTRAYIGYQAAGAYVTLAIIFAYSGRRYFKEAFLEAFRGVKDTSDANELMPRRVAVFGVIVGYIGIVAWTIWAGMTPWLAAVIWAIYIFVTATVLARGVCEAGFLMTETSFRPTDIVSMFSSRVTWGASNWTVLSMLNGVFFRDMRGLFLGLFMDDQRMAGDINMRRRNLIVPILIALFVSLVVGSATHLILNYHNGAVNLHDYGVTNAGWAVDDAKNVLNGAPMPIDTAKDWFGVGIIVTVVLAFLRSQFVGFPLNPLAYALAPSWTMVVMWFPILFTWIVKSLILRYGGSSLYRRARPLFLGLIIGEFGAAVVWAIASAVFKIDAPQFPWGG